MAQHNGPRPVALTRKREELAWDLAARGLFERQIAVEIEKAGLGAVTQQAVSAMLLRVEKKATTAMSAQVIGQKSRQTQSLRLIFSEAWAAWEKSKQTQKAVTKKVIDGQIVDGKTVAGREETTTHIREQDGDPRYLDQAMKALTDIRKLWGLDAPHKIAPTNPEGTEAFNTAVVIPLIQGATDAELEELRKTCVEIRNRTAAPTDALANPEGASGEEPA